jgi:S-adenosylmethionine synthetase
VDTYGGLIPHGGGAFSGKDPSKVDRSGAYAARQAAVFLVKKRFAARALVQLSYAIGHPTPTSVTVDTFGTNNTNIDDVELAKVLQEVYDFTPAGIITGLDLLKPFYRVTAQHGHFGWSYLPWEKY